MKEKWGNLIKLFDSDFLDHVGHLTLGFDRLAHLKIEKSDFKKFEKKPA